MRSDLQKLDFFTLETSKNHLIRNFLRNELVRVKAVFIVKVYGLGAVWLIYLFDSPGLPQENFSLALFREKVVSTYKSSVQK